MARVAMASRRFTRLTNGFSKKLDHHHCAAVALFVAHYNLCRVHETLRETPAMALGMTNHAWPVGKLVTTVPAMTGSTGEMRRYGYLGVVEGGRGESL